MSESLSDLEKEVEESRARLDRTIDRIQDRLTPGNLVDEMLGSARRTPLNGLYDEALTAVRRNPLPVLLIAAGVGMLVNSLSRSSRAAALSGGTPATEPANEITPGRVAAPDRQRPNEPPTTDPGI